jgi:hypothetical protein
MTSSASLTDRYVWAVLRSIPEPKRADIENELRASIADDIDARVANGESEADAELAVLRDLGEPARLAAGYAGRPLALIGPALYVDYVKLLRLLLVIVLPCATVAVLLAQLLGGAGVGEVFGATVATVIGVGVHLCFWTTLLFVVLERTGSKAPLAPFDPALLPAVPAKGATTASDLIGSVLFLVFTVGAILWQQNSSVFVDAAGDPIPVLDPALWSFWLPYFIALAVLTFVHGVVLFQVGRWSLPLAIANVVLNLATAVPLIGLILTGGLYNEPFFAAFDWDQVVAPDGVATVPTVLAIAVIAIAGSVDGFVKVRRSARTLADELKDGIRRVAARF